MTFLVAVAVTMEQTCQVVRVARWFRRTCNDRGNADVRVRFAVRVAGCNSRRLLRRSFNSQNVENAEPMAREWAVGAHLAVIVHSIAFHAAVIPVAVPNVVIRRE